MLCCAERRRELLYWVTSCGRGAQHAAPLHVMRRLLLLTAFILVALNLLAQESAKDKAGIWLDVPFIKQTVEGCGSASIAMLLQYWSAHGTQIAPVREDADAVQ